ncbi:LOW QUALITY PROTEIN: hypothetical protein RvY_06064 [Ramazzottius varieornatus]|uniref:Reverse transcriptase domain-containing protein n=1 Tax=Ramazzottius varieornatus TaxID=947166 RepID=A0A1D1V627_RAMVA|nr:LOW QUALITY PROTEIN: hypothetical protein RvY_06064 [Ramazzottius varieornatus]
MEHIPPFLRRNLIIVGDFNCPKIQWEGKSNGKSARDRDLISLKKQFKLWQKFGFVRNTHVVPPPSSTCDHRAIETRLLLSTPNFKPTPKPVWKIDGDKINFFKETLSSIDWRSIFDVMCNVDVAVSVFQDKFVAAAKSAFQQRSVGAQRLHRPSLPERAIDSLRRCGSAYKQWRRTKDQVDFLRWKEVEASKRRIIQSEKYRRLCNLPGRNPRTVWKHIKKNTSNAPILPIPVHGEEERYIVHPQEKAEFISKEFAQVYIACPQHCPPPANSCGEPIRIQSPKTPHCPPLRITTPLILEQLRRFDSSKASGSFLITNRLLKIAGTSILYPLSRLFNLIVSCKQYPTVWKQADVVPVPKKGCSQFPSISVLPPLSKLFEKIVANHLTNYLNSHGLLSDSQFGFRRRRSTEMQLLLMAHHYSQALLRREEVDAVFLDCSKAFDKLPHSTIVASLSSHGVERELKDLLSDYLPGRIQRVVIDGHFSTERAVPSGVSQGTKKLQRQLESIQKKFLQSIRLSPADKEDQSHDPDFSRYLQHLREVGWKPLWHRRCENILGTAYKIWNGTFANAEQLMKVVQPSPNLPTRSHDKAMMLSSVSMAPSSRALLESTVGSFAYNAEALLKDPLFCPSFVDFNSPGSFKNYVDKLHLSKFMWCKKYIDGNLLV